ncbi:hypothetical protein [Collinsella ihumii]|uniref:hypothetical protein n=1 Tax=Collinsella ihumii TaxID=1720204 RepID=UPI0025AA42A3|nr:hypothetical protein [Collinsella ihumii]MDN0055553.1 hypothetical protein [Collinsella ihumii]
MSTTACRSFIVKEIHDCGGDIDLWAVDRMAEDLDRRLEGADPGELSAAEAADFFNRWNGRVVNKRGGLVDYARFLTYADPGIMAVIAAGGLTDTQETFECYSALHRGKFGVEFPIWAGTF